MKWVFSSLIGLSIIFGIINGKMADVSNAALSECANGVTLCITMLGIMCLWGGIMRIAEKSGVTAALSILFKPLVAKVLFKGINPEGKAFHAICMNITANLLGLGNAATPLGIEAIRALEEEDKTTDTASDNMIMLVVLNTASIQLIPTTIAALRLKHGSAAPMEILPCILLTSLISVTVGVTIAKTLSKRKVKIKINA